MGLNRNMTVNLFICNGQWSPPYASTPALSSLWHSIASIRLPLTDVEDQIIWAADQKCVFSTSSAIDSSFLNSNSPLG